MPIKAKDMPGQVIERAVATILNYASNNSETIRANSQVYGELFVVCCKFFMEQQQRFEPKVESEPERIADLIIRRANDGYHGINDCIRWSAYIKKVAAEVLAEELG